MFTELVNKIQELFKSEDQEVELSSPKDTLNVFELKYKNDKIGSLKLSNGVWSFNYTDEFKLQNNISPLVDFPDKNKIYSSNSLFPFFASRIPSLQRLKIQKAIPENITNDEVFLLKMFGKQTIANPYELIALN